MPKQLSDGSFVVRSESDLEAAIEELQQREGELRDIEEVIESDYAYETLRKEHRALETAVKAFVMERGKDYEIANTLLTVVRPKKWHWDGSRLSKLVPKSVYLRLCDVVPSSDKIEQAIKSGEVDRDQIESAYVADPISAYVKMTRQKDDSDKADDEAKRIREQLEVDA